MAGIYFHIPFCKKACHYCDFHFSTSLLQLDPLLHALENEIALRKNYLLEPIETIYLGGGTPSLIPPASIKNLLEFVHASFSVSANAEITLEANPDDITAEQVTAWKKAGINRMSVGVQSFHPHLLQWMNRAHDANQSVEAITLLQKGGFENISLDLIYGCPNQSDESWEKDVRETLALGVPHISCYALTSEPNTALWHMIKKGDTPQIQSEQQARQFILLMEWMQAAGYEHYEISNFSLPHQRSRHNSAYWKGVPYLGIGPSAHSFNGIEREWNISNNAGYIASIGNGILPNTKEILTTTQQVNEYIMTSLRTMEGISMVQIADRFGKAMPEQIMQDAQSWIREGLLQLMNQQLILTRAGKLLADGIAADLFREEPEL
ncbi:MAG: radical SAM family heme chaperone HemW [Bacteroidetes bacterium]|nr:radical SAM family heme chaperone HemW [Bacteroidota bacterium]